MKRYYAKNDNSPFMCHLFSRVLEFMDARKTCHRVVRTSMLSTAYSGELCNKNCIVKTSETLIVWSASCQTARSGKWNAIKGVPGRLLKRAAMVFMVDILNCGWPIDAHSQQWLLILRELCAIIEAQCCIVTMIEHNTLQSTPCYDVSHRTPNTLWT